MVAAAAVNRRTPFVLWAQDEDSITLRVDVQKVEEVDLRVLESGHLVSFSASSSHAANEPGNPALYSFEIPLDGKVEEQFRLEKHENRVEVHLRKANPGFWKSGLLDAKAQKQAHNWLKFDFDKWRDDPEEAEEEQNNLGLEDNDNKFPYSGPRNANLERLLREMERENGGNSISLMSDEEFARKMNLVYGTYLLLYNICMFGVNFLLLALILFRFFSTEKSRFLTDFWPAHFHSLLTCTCLQYLDVLHSVTGLTKGSYTAGLIQVTGRLTMLLIVNGCPSCAQWPPVFTLMVVYLLSEQFRYPFYALNSVGIAVPVLTWLRYTAWLLLYPIGLLLEAAILLGSIPHYYNSGVYSLRMPNAFNMDFNFGIFLAFFTTICFPYIGYTLLGHMFRQRRAKMAEMYKTNRKVKKQA